MSDKKNILVVDDDEDFLESFHLLLLSEDHRVFTCTNYHDAITAYLEIEPDIVFLDMKMPYVGGYETFLRIKKYDADARVVFTSNYTIDEAKYQQAKQKQLADSINKPIELDTIRRVVKKHAK